MLRKTKQQNTACGDLWEGGPKVSPPVTPRLLWEGCLGKEQVQTGGKEKGLAPGGDLVPNTQLSSEDSGDDTSPGHIWSLGLQA